jgi:hypothetical protein
MAPDVTTAERMPKAAQETQTRSTPYAPREAAPISRAAIPLSARQVPTFVEQQSVRRHNEYQRNGHHSSNQDAAQQPEPSLREHCK